MRILGRGKRNIRFTYPNGYEGEEYTGDCQFSIAYFKADPSAFSRELCLASYGLALASFGSPGEKKEKNIADFLTKIGCKNIYLNPDYLLTPHPRSIGCALGVKKIGWKTTLYILGVRGGAYGGEWGGNFLLGREGDHEGFSIVADKALSFLKEHIAKDKGNKILWLAGFSRGGGVANLIAGRAIDANLFARVYCYCFEPPSATVSDRVRNPEYRGIHNIIDPGDLVALATPPDYGFDLYGTRHYFADPMVNKKTPKEFFVILRTLADYDGKEYAFHMKSATLGTLLSGFKSSPNDPKNASTPASFFIRRAVSAIVSAAGGREEFVDNIQSGLVTLGSLVEGSGNPFLRTAELVGSLVKQSIATIGVPRLLAQGLVQSPKLRESLLPIIEKEISARNLPLDKAGLSKSIASLVFIILKIATRDPALVATLFDENNLKAILAAHSHSRVYAKLKSAKGFDDNTRFGSIFIKVQDTVFLSNAKSKRLYPTPDVPVASFMDKKNVELLLPVGEYILASGKGKVKITLVHDSKEVEEIEIDRKPIQVTL